MAFCALHSAPAPPCRCVQRPSAAAPHSSQQRPAQRRQSLTCRAALTRGRSTASVADLKRSILSQAGSKCGLDKTEAQKAAVVEVVEDLERAGKVKDVDFTGTTWRLAFSTSTTESAGKLGPFTGRVRQEFPADLPGQYLNRVEFFGGLVQARLLGNYMKQGRQRTNLLFLWTEFSLGPFKFKKEFPPGFKGHWSLKYVDEDMRCFSTNKGNVFVLQRVDE